MLNQKKVAVYVTGGIAAYKALLFVRLLIKEGAQVKVAMTQSACQFVSPLTFQVLTKEKVMVETFDENDPSVVQHILQTGQSWQLSFQLQLILLLR